MFAVVGHQIVIGQIAVAEEHRVVAAAHLAAAASPLGVEFPASLGSRQGIHGRPPLAGGEVALVGFPVNLTFDDHGRFGAFDVLVVPGNPAVSLRNADDAVIAVGKQNQMLSHLQSFFAGQRRVARLPDDRARELVGCFELGGLSLHPAPVLGGQLARILFIDEVNVLLIDADKKGTAIVLRPDQPSRPAGRLVQREEEFILGIRSGPAVPFEMVLPARATEQQAAACRRVVPRECLLRAGVKEVAVADLSGRAERELAESARQPLVVRFGEQERFLGFADSRVFVLFGSHRGVFLVDRRRYQGKAESEIRNRLASERFQSVPREREGHATALRSVLAGGSECRAFRLAGRQDPRAVRRLGDVQAEGAARVQDLSFVAGAKVEEQVPAVVLRQAIVAPVQLDGQGFLVPAECDPAAGSIFRVQRETLCGHKRVSCLEHGCREDVLQLAGFGVDEQTAIAAGHVDDLAVGDRPASPELGSDSADVGVAKRPVDKAVVDVAAGDRVAAGHEEPSV